MNLSELIDAYQLNVVASYSNKVWTYTCSELVKTNGEPITGRAGHPVDALLNMAKSASGRHLLIVPNNIAINPIQFERW